MDLFLRNYYNEGNIVSPLGFFQLIRPALKKKMENEIFTPLLELFMSSPLVTWVRLLFPNYECSVSLPVCMPYSQSQCHNDVDFVLG